MDGQWHQTRAERMLEQGAFRRIWATYNDAAQLVIDFLILRRFLPSINRFRTTHN